MRRFIAVLIALCALTLPVLSLADGARTVTVTGTASFTVEADFAVLSLGVLTAGREAADAASANAQAMEGLMAALIEAGIADDDITTANYYVNTIYDYEQMGLDGSAAIRGYSVSNHLSVTVRDIASVGDIIDTALANGANSCDSISFRSSRGEEMNDLALSAAVTEALRKARIVAQAAGAEAGDILSITEQAGTYSGAMFARNGAAKAEAAEESAADAAYGTQIRSDGLSFFATVILTVELKAVEE